MAALRMQYFQAQTESFAYCSNVARSLFLFATPGVVLSNGWHAGLFTAPEARLASAFCRTSRLPDHTDMPLYLNVPRHIYSVPALLHWCA